MKKIFYLFILLLDVRSSLGQETALHQWSATITVVNEIGVPIAGADTKVIFSTFTPSDKRVSTNISGLSDAYGSFRVKSAYTGVPDLLFRASKAGFYSAATPYDLGDDYSAIRWNPSVQLKLRRIQRPIPMYAALITLEVPQFEKQIGFDLMAADWVGPYGKGTTADLVFDSHYYNKRSKNDFDHQLTLTFSNPADGIQPFITSEENGGSELRSPYYAPPTGYEARLTRTTSNQPDRFASEYDPRREFFFRVRTVLDNKGDVKSALYGKIYGDINEFTYYLNPTPNDRDVEFDPAHNLISGQRVGAP